MPVPTIEVKHLLPVRAALETLMNELSQAFDKKPGEMDTFTVHRWHEQEERNRFLAAMVAFDLGWIEGTVEREAIEVRITGVGKLIWPDVRAQLQALQTEEVVKS